MLPAGTSTWEHLGGHQQSTVDVILASAGLVAQVVRCWVHEHDHGWDHQLIAVQFDVKAPRRSHHILNLGYDAVRSAPTSVP